jgi:hypothetical protein
LGPLDACDGPRHILTIDAHKPSDPRHAWESTAVLVSMQGENSQHFPIDSS